METSGHAATAPGLRGHSIGTDYPYTVIRYGNGDFAAKNCRTGAVGPRRRNYHTARIDVLVRNV